MKQRCVSVLGMHRSGTSIVTGVLHHLGVDMGQPDPPIIKWDSPLGQYEDLGFVRLDDEILAAAGGSWDNPPSPDAVAACKDQFDDRIRRFVQSKQAPIWGWKTARNAFTFDLYKPYLPSLDIIVCKRDRLDVCKSLEKRNGMSINEASALYSDYYDAIRKCCDRSVNYVEFEYGQPGFALVDAVAHFLGLRVSAKQRSRAIEHVLNRGAVAELVEQLKKYDDIKLDVGCGNAKHSDWVGIDIRPLPGVDIVWDLTNFPWPLANSCCNQAGCNQVWEIIEPKYRLKFMDELWRLLKPGAELDIAAPHARVRGAYQDPLHYGCPNEVTFWYFDPRHPRYGEYRPLPWTIKNQVMASDNVIVTMSPNK